MDGQALARLIAVTGPAGSSNDALAAAVRRVRDAAPGSSAVILAEGISDQAALESLAARRGRDLRREGIFVVPMGGATNIGSFLDLFGPQGLGARLAGRATRRKRTISAAPWRGPAWIPVRPAMTWNDSASTCAWPIWKMR